MLDKIILENFKGYERLEVAGLQRINLIAGMNNTGKTSILEAIFMHFDRMSADVFIRPFVRRGVQQFDLLPEYMFHPYFNDFNISKPIKVSTFDSGHKSISQYSLEAAKNQNVAVNKNNYFMNSVLESASTLNESIVINYSWNGRDQGKATISINNNQLEMHMDKMTPANKVAVFVPASARGNSISDAQFISKLDIMHGLNEFTDYLKMVDPRLRSVSLVSAGGQPTLYVDVGLKRKIPMTQMGEGISKLTSILTAILSNTNAVVLIDEIENGIHYSLMPSIWKMIFTAAQKQNCQVFATTHSNDIIKGLSKYLQDDEKALSEQQVAYIRLDRNKKGEVIPKNYDAAALLVSVERDWDIR